MQSFQSISTDQIAYFHIVASETPYAKRYEIASAIQHPAYSMEKDTNDIGLLKLRRPIAFNAGVGPVCLPFK